jgi:hypothetical protein
LWVQALVGSSQRLKLVFAAARLRPRKKIPVFPLTCSKIFRSVGRKKILFLKIFLASFYRGHIPTLIVLVQKWGKKI